MKLSPLQASLLALAVSIGGPAALAQPAMLLAQAETDGQSQDVAVVQKFLAGGKDLSRLDEDRLQQRLARAKKLRQLEGLPPELDDALQQEIAQIENELAQRQQQAAEQPAQPEQQPQQPTPKLEEPPLPPAVPDQAQEQPAPQDQSAEQDQQPAQQQKKHRRKQQAQDQQQTQDQQQAQQPPAAEQPAAEAQPPVQSEAPADAGNPDVAAFLQSVRPGAELSQDEIRQQIRRAMELSQAGGLSPAQRSELRGVIKDSREALRQEQSQPQSQEQAQQPQEQPPVAEQPAAPQPPVAEQPVAPQPPVAEQQAQPQLPKPQTDQQLAKPSNVDPQLELRAREMLADTTDVSTMKRKQLRKRLSEMRDLLATNQLSVDTREALRQKLATDRQVLRNDVAVEEGVPPPDPQMQPPPQQGGQKQPGQQQGGQQQPPQQGGNTTSNVTINNNTTVNNVNTDVRVVLKDRRPPQQLDDQELVRRIDVYRNVVQDDRYAEEERMMWQQQMEDDRRFLRRRMIEERRQREARLRSGNVEFNINVEDQYDPGREVPDDVFAAEVEDSEIADVLAAPPRRQIQRRYTVDDIERSPQVREAVARIEIDTVHFGFGEGFLREEEIDKLDRIATVLEKILAKHPDEVFLIEGHTDAVGSDQANLVLSRQRAAAVKQALVTYYVIPADNLKTVGLGERYLKIPTDRPEAENRRVSLARITALVGQAD